MRPKLHYIPLTKLLICWTMALGLFMTIHELCDAIYVIGGTNETTNTTNEKKTQQMKHQQKQQNLGTVGLIARFKPLHHGAALLLETVCRQAEHVKIGIGSSNKYNARNPFTVEESKVMLDLVLKQHFNNYEFLEIPDFAHLPEYQDGQKWRQYVLEKFGPLDHFVSGNTYVCELLKNDYQVIPSATLIPPEHWIKLRSSDVRLEMAQHGNWQKYVPAVIAEYLQSHGLVQRFQQQFGLETLASIVGSNAGRSETAQEEYEHTKEVSDV